MLPSVRDILDSAELRSGDAVVVGGASGLDRPVRWVHISELQDIARLLKGGELVLTTGIGLHRSARGLRAYVADLADADAAGIVIELGRRFTDTPLEMAREADKRGLPLIELRREIPFVSVTEHVHAVILDAQVRELRASELIHETFTRLSVEGATNDEVVRRASRMLDAPVVLESLAHQVLAFDAASSGPEEIANDWEAVSRKLQPVGRTDWIAGSSESRGWLVTKVGVRGETWGRLVAAFEREPTSNERSALERAATTLALNHLVERDRETLDRQAHRSLIESIVERRYTSEEEVHLRARSLGFPMRGRLLTVALVQLLHDERRDAAETRGRWRTEAELVARAARDVGMKALVRTSEAARIVLLISHARNDAPDGQISRLAEALLASAELSVQLPIRVGSSVENLSDVRESYREAEQVAGVAVHAWGDRLYARLEDVRLHGLLHLLRDDPRVQTFVDREIGRLLAHDASHRGSLMATLRAFLDVGGNKSAAAAQCGLSRPLLYKRLHSVERIASVSLESAESRLSLHLAILALDAMRAVGAEHSG